MNNIVRGALVFALFFLASLHSNAYEERNLLQNAATKQEVKESLVMDQKWVNYPAYSDRQGWDRFLGELKNEYIRIGEEDLDFEWIPIKATDYLEYERSGDRRVMEEPMIANTEAIAHLVMAELAEGKGRFLDQIINCVFSACEMTSWSWSAHVGRQKTKRSLPSYDDPVLDLLCAGMGNMLSWTYYFLKDEFAKVDPEISRRLRHTLQVQILDTYLHNDTFSWMARGAKGSGQNNWNVWCNSNCLMCFMLLENDKDVLADAVYESMRSVDQYLNYVKADGASDEGTLYWEQGSGKLFDYLELLSLITGGKVDLLKDPSVKARGEYIYHSYVGDGWIVNFADAYGKSKGNPYLVYRFGKAVGSEGMMRYAASIRGTLPAPSTSPYHYFANEPDLYRVFKSIEIRDELLKANPEPLKDPFTWYPETEVCFMSNDNGLFFAGKGGHNNESHNHNDIGSFNFYVDKRPIMIDAGVATYRRGTFSSNSRYTLWNNQSTYHNLPVINGSAQKGGAQYKSSDAVAKPGFFSLNIAGAYPEEAKVEKWTRSYQLKDTELRINDVFTLSEAVAPNIVNFMTWGDVRKVSDGKISITVDGVKTQLTYDPKVFDYSIETIPLDDVRLTQVWGDKIYRMSFTAKKLSKTGKYAFTIRKQ